MIRDREVRSLAIQGIGAGIGAAGATPAWTRQDAAPPAPGTGRHAEAAGSEPPGAGRETPAEEAREGEGAATAALAAAQPATYTREGRMVNVARLQSLPPRRLDLLV